MDFFGSRRCLRRPGFDSYFAPIIKFIRPDYYQCFLSNWDIMVFFGQLTVFLSLDLFCCYGCRACFFGTSQHITCSQSVFASVVPHQDQPIFPCQLWKKSISPWASKMMPAVATKLAPEAEATTNAGPDLWKVTICPHNHLFRLIPHGGWWGIKLATATQAKPGWHVGVEFVMRTSPRHEINHVEAERQTDCWVTGSGLRYWVAGVHRWWWLLHEGWSLRATVDRHFSIDLLYHEDESYWVKIITFGHPPLGQTNPGYHPLWVFLPNCLVNAYSSFLWVGSEKKSSSNIAISLNIKCGH